MKRSPLKRTRSPRPLTPTQMQDLLQRVMLRDGGCVAAGLDDSICSEWFDAAHIIAQKILKAHYPLGDPIFRDDRNVLCLCRDHHHALDAGFLEIPEDRLPLGFGAFCREFGFEWNGRYWSKVVVEELANPMRASA